MSKHNQKHKQHESHVPDETGISVQEIEILAYRIHEEKGGTDFDNWLEAEKVIKEKQ